MKFRLVESIESNLLLESKTLNEEKIPKMVVNFLDSHEKELQNGDMDSIVEDSIHTLALEDQDMLHWWLPDIFGVNTMLKYMTRVPDFLFSEANCDKDLVIPSNITYIGGGAFQDTDVDSITLLAKIEDIPSRCFRGSNVKTVKILSSIKRIDEDAFRECELLKSITIPKSVNEIRWDAFVDCLSLEKVNILGVPNRIEDRTFLGCKSLTEINIPSSVISIGKEAFKYCSSLRKIIIPNSVESIEESAFYGCEALEEITIPDSVYEISPSAFRGCESIKLVKTQKGSDADNCFTWLYFGTDAVIEYI